MKRLKWFSGLLVMVLVLGFMNVGGAAAQIPTPALYVIDETGGDCDLIGDWGTDTVWEGRDVCFLTQDVYGSVQIDGSGLGLDGNGYRIIGPPPDNVEDGFGVYFQASDVVLQHLDVSGFFVGIYSSGSQGMRVLNSLIHDNYIGIGTLNSTDVVAFNKTVVNNYYGFFVQEPVEGDEKFGLVGFSNIVANNAVGVYVRDDPGNSSNNGPLVALIYNVFWNNGGGGTMTDIP